MPFSPTIKIVVGGAGKDDNANNIPDEAESLSDGTTTVTLAEVEQAIDDVGTLETEVTQLGNDKLDKTAPVDGGGF